MTTVSRNGRADAPDLDALRKAIVRKRAALAETVEALAAKADVKARTRGQMAMAKTRARRRVRRAVDDAATTGRRFREHPGTQVRTGTARLRRSVREHPAPWAVAAGALALALVVLPRRFRT